MKFKLTLILLMWRIWWASNNASRWQMGFNSVFKGLILILKRSIVQFAGTFISRHFSLGSKSHLHETAVRATLAFSVASILQYVRTRGTNWSINYNSSFCTLQPSFAWRSWYVANGWVCTGVNHCTLTLSNI